MDVTTISCSKTTKKRFDSHLVKYQAAIGERINTDTFLNVLMDTGKKGMVRE
jgi:hypothetical protein